MIKRRLQKWAEDISGTGQDDGAIGVDADPIPLLNRCESR